MKRAGHPGRIGHIRSDLFLGLLDGRFHGMTLAQVTAALIADYRPAGPAGEAAAPGDSAGPAGDAAAPASEEAAGYGRGPDARTGADTAGSGSASRAHSEDDADTTISDDAHSHCRDDARPTDADNDSCDMITGTRTSRAGTAEAGPDATGEAGSDASGHTETSDGLPLTIDPPPPTRDPAGGTGGARDERVGIEIRIGLATLLGRDEHPAEIPGLGLLIAPDARLRVAFQGRSEWRFAVTDTDGALLSEGRTGRRPAWIGRIGPRDGIVEIHIPATLLAELMADPTACGGWRDVVADIAAQHTSYAQHVDNLDAHPDDRLPGAGLRRHTEIRDRTCTFAGVCRHPAHRADIDHSHDHARGGATVRINLGPLCEHDHGVKHEAGWTVTQPEPGLFVWHSPLGGEYPARGELLLPELPEPVPPEPETEPYVFRHLEGPILRRPPPPPPPPPAPPPQPPPGDDADDPPF